MISKTCLSCYLQFRRKRFWAFYIYLHFIFVHYLYLRLTQWIIPKRKSTNLIYSYNLSIKQVLLLNQMLHWCRKSSYYLFKNIFICEIGIFKSFNFFIFIFIFVAFRKKVCNVRKKGKINCYNALPIYFLEIFVIFNKIFNFNL